MNATSRSRLSSQSYSKSVQGMTVCVKLASWANIYDVNTDFQGIYLFLPGHVGQLWHRWCFRPVLRVRGMTLTAVSEVSKCCDWVGQEDTCKTLPPREAQGVASHMSAVPA